MQSLIHGNFEGAAQKKVYALVGAAAAIAAAVGPLLGGFITTYLSWRVAFGLEVVVIGVVLSGLGLVRDVPYTGDRSVDVVGSLLSVVGMGGVVLGILVWQEGGEAVGALIALGAISLAALAYWLRRRKREGRPALLDAGLFESAPFRIGITQQMLQQIALGGAMIALPIYLQLVLEYDAMEAGLSLAPLSLSMFAVALLAGRRAGDRRPPRTRAGRLRGALRRAARADRDRPERGLGLGPGAAADRRGLGPRPARLAAQQLHAGADLRGARLGGRRRQLGGRLVRALLRPGVRGRDHARDALDRVHGHGGVVRRAARRPSSSRSRTRSRTTPR